MWVEGVLDNISSITDTSGHGVMSGALVDWCWLLAVGGGTGVIEICQSC